MMRFYTKLGTLALIAAGGRVLARGMLAKIYITA
jgi:hypothetical protein